MRELEFRLFDTTSKKMYYMPNIGEYTIEQIFRFAETDDPYTKVMQFTGLLDKNGTKIFEGDKVQSYHFTDTKGRDHFITHVVEWSGKFNGWFMRNEESNDDTGCIQMWVYMRSNKHSAEAIGNIHEDNHE